MAWKLVHRISRQTGVENDLKEYGMSLNVTMKRAATAIVAATASMLVYTGAHAAIPASAFADPYQAVPAVAENQSQVVYYRDGTAGHIANTAHVYIDNEFHTSLLPGGFTVFCLAPGAHGLNAVLDDAPRYEGKKAQPRTTLEGGKTYFLKVSEAGAVLPTAVTRVDAEKALARSPRQAHVLSRASAIKACNYLAPVEPQVYTLSGDVLFAFGKAGYSDVREDGRRAVASIVRELQQDGVALDRIEVVGHTDPIGSDAANETLGLMRAQTVRQMLIESGLSVGSITVQSMGRRDLLVDDCLGDRSHLISCNSPNRRVVIQVYARR